MIFLAILIAIFVYSAIASFFGTKRILANRDEIRDINFEIALQNKLLDSPECSDDVFGYLRKLDRYRNIVLKESIVISVICGPILWVRILLKNTLLKEADGDAPAWEPIRTP